MVTTLPATIEPVPFAVVMTISSFWSSRRGRYGCRVDVTRCRKSGPCVAMLLVAVSCGDRVRESVLEQEQAAGPGIDAAVAARVVIESCDVFGAVPTGNPGDEII